MGTIGSYGCNLHGDWGDKIVKTVCLIHPPHPNSMDDRLDPPMGLLYIATHLRQCGMDVKVVDLSGLNKWEIPYAEIYGITAYISSLSIIRQLVKDCRAVNPLSKIVIGGAHASARPDDFPYSDHVVVGPGEHAMADLALGISHDRVVKGQELKNPFLFPSFDLVDVHSYHRTIAEKPSISYLTSRGCPYSCSFCGLTRMHQLGGKVVMATPEVVYEQVREIKEKYGIDRINFQDDIFTLNHERLFKILDLIQPLGIKFRCMGRAGHDTEEVYKRLARAGCDQVAWGIESGSQHLLDLMNKQSTVLDNYNVIQWAKKYGITSRAFFIIGFPGETKETMRQTQAFINWADPDQFFVSNFVPYPGTEVGDCPEKYGITRVSGDFSQFYQVSKDGTGGIAIDTKWLSGERFRELELDFRGWLATRSLRGGLQDYEKGNRREAA